MKKSVLEHLKIFVCCSAFFIPALALRAEAQSSESGNVKTTITKVKTFDGSAVIPYAGASLSRNNEGIFMTFDTSGLAPETVVTLWWVIFNNPKNCATPNCGVPDLFNPDVNASLQYAGGRIVGIDRRVNFGGFLAEGDNTGFHILPGMPDPAPGLENAKGAAIHLVVRSHGPASADPATLTLQLTTFGGGCTVVPNPCANLQAAQFLP